MLRAADGTCLPGLGGEMCRQVLGCAQECLPPGLGFFCPPLFLQCSPNDTDMAPDGGCSTKGMSGTGELFCNAQPQFWLDAVVRLLQAADPAFT